MTTRLTKIVRRRSEEMIRYGSKHLPLVIEMHPDGFIGLRPAGCQKVETITFRAAYETAVRSRVDYEKRLKQKDKPVRVRRGRL